MQLSKYRCECDMWDGHQCARAARYEIDGVKLCTQHAGPIAIIKALASGAAKKLELQTTVADPLCQLTSIYDMEWYKRRHSK